jgi:hypothetical protein
MCSIVCSFLVLSVCFVDRCLSFCNCSFGHCVVCSSSIYGFWLPHINNRGINTTIICKLKNILFICKKKSKENPYFLYHVLVSFFFNRIGGVMVSVLGSSAVDRGFESRKVLLKEERVIEWMTCLISNEHFLSVISYIRWDDDDV